jgi:hypothetical protein
MRARSTSWWQAVDVVRPAMRRPFQGRPAIWPCNQPVPRLLSCQILERAGQMAEDTLTTSGIGRHGVTRLPSVDVDSYNIELKDDDGFLGDRASKGAFQKILDGLRKPLQKNGDDPLGNKPAQEIGKSTLDEILVGDDVAAAAIVHGAVEEFAQELAYVTRRFLKTKAWADTERIVVGGGFRQSRLGELAIARTGLILKAEGFDVDLIPIRFHPDEAGLIGCLHLAPSWIFEAYDSILAVDIGGSNIRCGVVETRWKKAPDLSKASVWKSDLWRHADDEPTREGAVKRLVKMLKDLIAAAEAEGFKLAPFIGISCPGVIDEDGSIEKGAQNLPGNWESSLSWTIKSADGKVLNATLTPSKTPQGLFVHTHVYRRPAQRRQLAAAA